MPRGGYRPGSGRKKNEPRPEKPELPEKIDARELNGQDYATAIVKELELASKDEATWVSLSPGARSWAPHWFGRDALECKKYLIDRRFGRTPQKIEYIHNKPLEIDMRVSLATVIQEARKRAGI